MRFSLRTTVVVAVAALIGALLAPPVSAAVGCVFTPGNALVQINMSAHNDLLEIVRDGANLDLGIACAGGTPTVNNTNLVNIVGSNGSQTVAFTLAGGPLGPGKASTGEGSGKPEIEFTVNLGEGTDELFFTGSSGPNTLRLGQSGINWNDDNDADVTIVNADEPLLQGAGGDDVVTAAGGKGTGSPSNAFAVLRGGPGNDRLTGGDSQDQIEGDVGKDILSGGADEDDLYGDDGSDTLMGGADEDGLYPGSQNDKVFGGGGDDYMQQGTEAEGSDVYSGGPGIDSYDADNRTVLQRVDLDGKADDGIVNEKDNVKPDVENIYGGDARDILTGNGKPNALFGSEGEDKLVGGGGDDDLYGHDEDDELLGGPGDDSLNGYDGFDTLSGGPDKDSLEGGIGNDTVSGGPGNDSFSEGSTTSGADDLHGNGGSRDVVFYSSRAVAVVVTLDDNGNDGTSAAEFDNVHSDIENANGGSGGDTLTGVFDISNSLQGNGGIDTINGGSGRDFLNGGAGNDSITGGHGYDQTNGGDDVDTFHMTDGGLDYIDGGNGADNCADKDGIDTTVNCP